MHYNKGYRILMLGGKPVREHRHVMQLHLGRKLYSHEVVHHIDGNKLNNDISNLELKLFGEHSTHHNKERLTIDIPTALKLFVTLKNWTHVGHCLGVSGSSIVKAINRYKQHQPPSPIKYRNKRDFSVEDAMRLYAAGMTAKEIGAIYGVGGAAIGAAIRGSGVKLNTLRKRDRTKLGWDIEVVRAELSHGLSFSQVAKKLNIPKTSIASAIKRRGGLKKFLGS